MSGDRMNGPSKVVVGADDGPPRRRVLGVPEFSRQHRRTWSSAGADLLLSAMFVIAIFAPLLACWFGFESGMGLSENRAMAPRPKWTSSRVEDLVGQIDAYYRDWFGFRARLIHLESLVRYKWLRVSTADVVIGKDGWLFYAREGVIDNYVGAAPFTVEELSSWKNYLERRRSVVQAAGAKYLFVVAPDKPAIYPEELPDWIREKLSAATRLDQLLEYLRANKSPVEVLDLRPALRAAKSEGLVYFPQDTHWNGRGYYYAYRAILDSLGTSFPGLKAQELGNDLKIVTKQWGGGDWLMLGLVYENLNYPSDFIVPVRPPSFRREAVILPPIFPPILEPWNRPLKTVAEQSRYRMLLLHDSFMRTGFEDRDYIPFAENFAETIAVGGIPTEEQLSALVKQEHIDVVVEERVERHILGHAPL
jgi:alginate O-acetyltransferase complex protein AlgJ